MIVADLGGFFGVEDDDALLVGDGHLHVHRGLEKAVDAGLELALVDLIEGGAEVLGQLAVLLHALGDDGGQDFRSVDHGLFRGLQILPLHAVDHRLQNQPPTERGDEDEDDQDAVGEAHGWREGPLFLK